MNDDCPDCEIWRAKGAKFCSSCGKNLIQQKNPSPQGSSIHLVPFLAVLAISTLIISDLIFGFANFWNIFENCKGFYFTACISYGTGTINLFTITGNGVIVLLSMDLVAVLVCFILALQSYLKKAKKELNNSQETCTEKTPLAAASVGLCVSLVISEAYFLLAASTGNGVDVSWMDNYNTYQMALVLTRAGVREELMFRVFWIGLPMTLILIIKNKNIKNWKAILGGFGSSKLTIVLIAISAIIFGLAHSNGWGLTKVPDAVMGGVIFGYLYAEYGLHAAIIAHTANDTIQSLVWNGLGNEALALMVLSLIAIGVLGMVYWICRPNKEYLRIKDLSLFPSNPEEHILDRWLH